MPFDTNLPADGSLIVASELRNQLNALNDALVAIVAAGGITGVQLDGVTTLLPGEPATATVFQDAAGVLRFSFGIPQGIPGEVSTGQLNNEINNVANFSIQQSLNQSSNLSNSVTTLDTAFSDGEAELLRGKLNELILALRR